MFKEFVQIHLTSFDLMQNDILSLGQGNKKIINKIKFRTYQLV